jgi:hypothetical protein
LSCKARFWKEGKTVDERLGEVSDVSSKVGDDGGALEHSHKQQRRSAAVETSAKLENQHSEEQEIEDLITSLTPIQTPVTCQQQELIVATPCALFFERDTRICLY